MHAANARSRASDRRRPRGLHAVAVLAAACLGAALVPAASAQAADRPATPSTLASVYAGAAPGDRILLASGSYGAFRAGARPGPITITPASGATATMSLSFTGAQNVVLDGLTITGASLSGSTRNVTIRNSRFTGPTTINGLANANVLLERNTHNDIDAGGQFSSPARIHLSYSSSTPSGVTIRDSVLSGGDSDGIQAGVGVNVIGNTFRDILQDGPNHTDAIQLLGAPGSVIRGNYFRNTSSGIVAYDRVQRATIEDNVLDLPSRPWGIELYSDAGSVVRHNTLRYGSCAWNLPCGMIDLNRKSADPAGSGTVVVDNIATDVLTSNGSTVAERHHNLLRRNARTGDTIGTPVFAGGAAPTSYAGYALAAGSPGDGAASDGADQGARIGSAPTPSPSPSPTPTPTPTVTTEAIWTAPTNVRVGQTVTLDGTRSTGSGTLTCTWTFEDSTGATVWETLTGCKLVKAFKYADRKYVKLTVRGADGSTDSDRQSFVVSP